MSESPDTAQVVALAGLFQAARLVQGVARDGEILDEAAWSASLESVLRVDADSAADVYGGIERLRLGLELLCVQLGGRTSGPESEVMGYCAGLMRLERRLSRDRERLDLIGERVRRVALLAESRTPTHDDVIAELGEIYASSISTLGDRILVHGKPEHLGRETTASLVRALLLAGIRAVVLWRQCGGGRLHLLFGRGRALRTARRLREAIAG